MSCSREAYLAESVRLALENVRSGGGPFGCVIVRGAAIVGRGTNRVTATLDPTAHAEIVAVRDACATLGVFRLEGCHVYASCEPCPMCLAALYWTRVASIAWAARAGDAEAAGFDDRRIAAELTAPVERRTILCRHVPIDGADAPFRAWRAASEKTPY